MKTYTERVRARWTGVLPPDALEAQVKWEVATAAKRWYCVPKSWTWVKRPSLRKVGERLGVSELQAAKIIMTPIKERRSPAERFFNEKFDWSWMAMVMVAQQKQRTRFVHWRGDDNGP